MNLTTRNLPAELRAIAEEMLARNDRSPARAKMDLVEKLAADPVLILALFDITPDSIAAKALEYLRQMEARDPRPPLPVKPHTRRPPGQLQPAVSAKAMLSTGNQVARKILMVIDGVDIRDWTVGQCRTAGRHKAHEAYVLRVLGNMWETQPHTKRIGDLMADDPLSSIIEQGREHARDL